MRRDAAPVLERDVGDDAIERIRGDRRELALARGIEEFLHPARVPAVGARPRPRVRAEIDVQPARRVRGVEERPRDVVEELEYEVAVRVLRSAEDAIATRRRRAVRVLADPKPLVVRGARARRAVVDGVAEEPKSPSRLSVDRSVDSQLKVVLTREAEVADALLLAEIVYEVAPTERDRVADGEWALRSRDRVTRENEQLEERRAIGRAGLVGRLAADPQLAALVAAASGVEDEVRAK